MKNNEKKLAELLSFGARTNTALKRAGFENAQQIAESNPSVFEVTASISPGSVIISLRRKPDLSTVYYTIVAVLLGGVIGFILCLIFK